MKKMNGGMMQGYGAARTSGMGLEDESLPPGQMVRASKGTMAKVKKSSFNCYSFIRCKLRRKKIRRESYY
jgi:hypothetical protein